MAELIKLLVNPTDIDPFVIAGNDNVWIKLGDEDDAEMLEIALTDLAERGKKYEVVHGKTEDREINYASLRRTVA